MAVTAKHTASVADKKAVSPLVTWLKLKISGVEEFDFRPGQFINLEVGDGIYRSYSICNEAVGGPFVELAAITGRPGLGANFINELKIGSSAGFIGPSGRYSYRKPARKNVVFVATSTGIAPFIPMLAQALEDTSVESVTLVFGVRDQEDVFFEEKFKKFLETSPKFSYFICLSGVTGGLKPPLFANRVTFCLPDFVKEHTDFYLCGNTAMIRDCSDIINKAGLEDFAIYTEAFNPNL
ncbi:hypothetical protein A3K01_04035 [candidate division WWE3 bacterium RIFOXYD1_FULL_43_17]|nr:MAG: hypothetical protein A3K01_04035 [candidate division WWE3 bacterium RIFOXYD1_FULL_43_17]